MAPDFQILENIPMGCFLLNSQYEVVFWNKCLGNWIGISSEEVLGKDIRVLFPMFKKDFFQMRIQGVIEGGPPVIFSPQLHKGIFPFNGMPPRSLLLKAAQITSDSQIPLVFFSVEDVTELSFVIQERRAKELELRHLLKEREVLLREVHHRVKNNLSLLAGLIILHQEEVPQENPLGGVLDELLQKVYSISKIHEMLYQSKDSISLSAQDYFLPLANIVISSFTMTKGQIELISEFDDLALDVDQTINLGLIQVELLTNAIKYGISSKDSAWIRISLKGETDFITYSLENSGSKLPSEFSLTEGTGLGLRLVQLFTSQLQGSLTFTREPHTRYTITIPRNHQVS